MTPPRHLLTVGASARAAAQSAQRAGFAVTAIDLFADEDLTECATAIRSENYPADLVHLAATAPSGPWMYTGGLENHPRIVAEIAARRPLWGNDAAVLRRVRNPRQVHAVLAKRGLPALDVTLDPTDVPRDGTWLAKPLNGSGGKHIHPLDDRSPALQPTRRDEKRKNAGWYFQRRQPGLPASAIFLGHKRRGRLLGVSEQLVGQPWCIGSPFQYAGSICPLLHDDLGDDDFHAQLRELGDTLAGEFGLVGLFGVDGIIHDRRFWPVEVNPRYTASCEVCERLTGLNMVSLHARACHENLPLSDLEPRWPGCVGKLIVYARRDGEFADRSAAWVRNLNAGQSACRVADIPRVGTVFQPGDPIATLLAHGDAPQKLRDRLATLADELRDQLV